MVVGLESFKKWFKDYEEQYVIIGGTACSLLMMDEGLDFRATKDLDMVLIIEAITPEFGKCFWEYILNAEYEHKNKSTGLPQFYRFSHPRSREYPFMIELFTKHVKGIYLPDDVVLTPLPMDEDISSLSAILLDEDYYHLLSDGKIKIDDISILEAKYLILFKAKAWLDLTNRKRNGEHVDSKNIRKHKNDVFRLSMLLTPNEKVNMNIKIKQDMKNFLFAMQQEKIDTKQLGLNIAQEDILKLLSKIYIEE